MKELDDLLADYEHLRNGESIVNVKSRDKKVAALRAHCERLEKSEQRLSHAVSWLRAQANAEQQPQAKAAFIEAHNAVLGIAEGRYYPS